jgi:flavin reductase (DIM6/NTAB) family NADH-FMN oxidoreductase RutF
VFTVSVLERGAMELVRHFGTTSGRDVDKLAGVGWHAAPSGAPVLDEALAYFDCVLTATFPAGDHNIVLGRVAGGRIIDRAADPMLYAETGDTDGSSALYPPEL